MCYREYTTAITCANLPHLKAFVSKILPGYFDSAVRSFLSNRRSAAYKADPNTSTDVRSPTTNPDRSSARQSTRFSGRVSVSNMYWSGSPILEEDRKRDLRNIDSYSEDLMLESVPSAVVADGATFIIQDEPGQGSNRRSKGSDNWPL